MRQACRIKGVEVFVQSQNIRRAFRWSTNFNISLNRNKVLKLRNGVDEIEDFTFYAKVGKTMECYFIPEWAEWIRRREVRYGTTRRETRQRIIILLKRCLFPVKTNIGGGLNNFFSWNGINLGVNIIFANTTMMDNLAQGYTDSDGANFGGVYLKDAAKGYWQKPGMWFPVRSRCVTGIMILIRVPRVILSVVSSPVFNP